MHPDLSFVPLADFTRAQMGLLIVHIACGTLALAGSVAAIATRKGGPWHIRAGRVFTAAMVVVGLSAFILAIVRPNPFLFAIGVFSLYLSLAGWLAARSRRIGRAAAGLASAMLAAGAGMAVCGAMALAGQPWAVHLLGGLGVVMLVFGTLGSWRAIVDLRAWRAGTEAARARIMRHMQLMMGGSIAAWTAFAVVNGASLLPVAIVWFGPTILAMPLQLTWKRRLKTGSRLPVPAAAAAGARGVTEMH